jgi:hypothetical protein
MVHRPVFSQVFVSIISLQPCACQSGRLRLSSSMYSASLLRGKEETLTSVQKNLDKCPNFTYTTESRVIPVDHSGAFEHADGDYFPLVFRRFLEGLSSCRALGLCCD